MGLKKMVNLERSQPELAEAVMPSSIVSKYDYGLTLRFNNETLEKLNLDDEDVEVGDMLHFMAMAEVTSVSKHDTGGGEKCCVELQVTHLGIENENNED